ncbi:MAG TPA: hypothetical protein PLZ15_08905 [Melioribacteraceae bacterium]|nr:hypothetical protein [Melioribacteraceae bacterium]
MIGYIKNIIVLGSRSVFHNSVLVLLIWVFNALSAIVLTVPILNILMDNLGRSLLSDKLALQFDYMWFIQFQNIYRINFDQLPLSIYTVVGIYTMLQTFFLGGMISIFHIPEKNHIVDFFYGGVKYFFRFLKVTLVSLAFYVFAFVAIDYLGQLIHLVFRNSENIRLEFVFFGLRYVLLVFFIGVVAIISDYSKVALAVNDRTKILMEMYNAIKFIKKNFTVVFISFLIVSVIGAVGVAVYNILGKAIPRTPYYMLLLSFLLQQMLIIFRLLVRMLFSATEVYLFKDLSAVIIDAETH